MGRKTHKALEVDGTSLDPDVHLQGFQPFETPAAHPSEGGPYWKAFEGQGKWVASVLQSGLPGVTLAQSVSELVVGAGYSLPLHM